MDAAISTIYSVGHGNRSLDELVAALDSCGVATLVDVRAFPGSRRHPHFGREALERDLPARGIHYEWMRDLGGHRKPSPDSVHTGWQVAAFRAYADYMESEQFCAALAQLIALAREAPTAFMCAERLWWQCHRRLLSDALVAANLRVVHILDAGKSAEHELTPFLRIQSGRLVYRGLL